VSRKAFTFFELLAVVSVVGLLVVVTMPIATDARESAVDTVCKSRLRQLAQYAYNYALETGYYPWGAVDPNYHDQNYCIHSGGTWMYPREKPELHGVSTWKEYESFCWDFTKRKGDKLWKLGEMFGNDRGKSMILGCPKCVGDSDNWDGNNLTGYNYNVAYIGYVEGDAGTRRYPTRYEHVKFTDRVVVFGDGGYSGGANKFMRATKQDMKWDGSSSSLRKAGTQAFRHGVGKKRHCNMAFLDCHVESFYTPYKSNGKEGWVHEKSHTAFISSGNGIYGPRGWETEEEDIFTENR